MSGEYVQISSCQPKFVKCPICLKLKLYKICHFPFNYSPPLLDIGTESIQILLC